ncbi:MAG: hypothetical protein ACXAD7_09360 [Candidatus Kariarchaeaceae archaeon]|jgi:hypothetical protein
MKKNKLPLIILVFALLVVSLTNSPTITSVGLVNTPNTAINTGDTFLFTMETESYRDKYRTRDLWNTDNVSQTFQYEEEVEESYGIGLGDIDLFFARNVDPNGLDTTFLVDVWQVLQPGSNSTSYQNRADWDGQFQQLVWNNGSDDPWFNDESGRDYEDEDQQSTWSNSTYAIVTEEMESDTYRVDWRPPSDMGDTSGDLQADLDYRNVDTILDFPITVNNYAATITARTVVSEFSLAMYNQPWSTQENFMDKDVELSGTWNLEYSTSAGFLFDEQTGLLVEMYFEDSYNFWSSMNSSSFTIWDEQQPMGLALNPAPPITNATAEIYESETRSESRYMVLEEASSHWNGIAGAHVPQVSSGTYRLEEGDSLNYDIDGFTYYETDMLVDVANGQHKDDRYNLRDVDFVGELDMHIYRHDQTADTFFAINLDSTTQTGTDEGHDYGWEGGVQYRDQDWGPQSICQPICYPEFRLDEFSSPSNDSYEIAPFMDETRWVEFGDDDRDGGDDGGFRIEFDREIPMTGTYVETKYDDYSINGFNYFVEAEVRGAEYEKKLIQNNYEVYLGDTPIQAVLNVTASATQELVYDSWTGALLEFNQEQTVEISVFFDGTITMHDPSGNPFPMDALFDWTLYIDSGYYIEMNGHSNLYDEVQTDIPTDPSTVSTTTPVDTNTTTTSTTPGETSSDDTSDENTTPDLPLPVPFLPFAFGLAVITILYKRK